MMIQFCFFPFTFMDARQAKVVSLFFDKLGVLDIHGGQALSGPMADLGAKGVLEMLCPDMEKLANAGQKVQAYLDWAAVHKGNERNLRAMIRESAYLKDDSGVAAIQSEIRSKIASHTPGVVTSDTVVDSLAFLKFADIHDRESQDIQEALDALDRENAALFAELKGDEGGAASVDHDVKRSEPGDAMTDRRISAWLTAAADSQCLDTGGIPVLVTTSRAVMDQCLTGPDKAINALDIDSIKVHENGSELLEQRHRKIKELIGQTAQGQTPEPGKMNLDDAGQGTETARMQVRFFKGLGNMTVTQKNPGGQIGVCLVELNS